MKHVYDVIILGSGPGFTDRLSKRLRDQMGLAYTVWARMARSADLEPGTFAAYIGTSPATRNQAIDGMRAEIARFGGAPDDLFDGEKITFLSEVASAKSTKAALLDAHIGKIDVAIDDVADHVADGLGAQLVGGGEHGERRS